MWVVSYLGGCAMSVWCVVVGCAIVIFVCVYGCVCMLFVCLGVVCVVMYGEGL